MKLKRVNKYKKSKKWDFDEVFDEFCALIIDSIILFYKSKVARKNKAVSQ